MKETAELIQDLPWVTLLTLAAGYAGYFTSNVGLRNHHKTIDVVFSTLVYGLIATAVYDALFSWSGGMLWASITGFLTAVIFGALWNRVGRKAMYWSLRMTDISNNDDGPSAWATLLGERHAGVRQLYVKLQDGTWLGCNNLEVFIREPSGACTLGADGDILMYVTHMKKPGEADFTECTSIVGEWGNEITYIPKSQIARIDIRRLP